MDLFHCLRRRGLSLTVQAGKLKVDPREAVTAADKAEIVELLQPLAEFVAEWERGTLASDAVAQEGIVPDFLPDGLVCLDLLIVTIGSRRAVYTRSAWDAFAAGIATHNAGARERWFRKQKVSSLATKERKQKSRASQEKKTEAAGTMFTGTDNEDNHS